MSNSSRSGLGTRVLAWAVVIVVALFALKLVIGFALGLLQFLFGVVLIGLVVVGVIWALRHL